MKKTFNFLTILTVFIISTLSYGQVGIQTENPHPSSDLELGSVDKALYLNRVANTGTIADPQDGMIIYDLSEECIKAYQAGEWSECFGSGDGGGGNPPDGIDKPLGSGALLGQSCFDVVEVNDGGNCGLLSSRASQKVDFSTNNVHIYTFVPNGTVSNVRFVYVNLNGEPIESLTPDADYSGAVSSAATATAVFATDLNTVAAGLTRDNALKSQIYVIYNNAADGTGEDLQLNLSVSVQDCSCCGAYIDGGVWKVFKCHNEGADESLDPFTPSPGIYGTTYGRATAGANTICGAGFTIPTPSIWNQVIRNNTISHIGTFAAADGTSGVKFGEGLMLPAVTQYWTTQLWESAGLLYQYMLDLRNVGPNVDYVAGSNWRGRIRCMAVD